MYDKYFFAMAKFQNDQMNRRGKEKWKWKAAAHFQAVKSREARHQREIKMGLRNKEGELINTFS